MWQQPWYALAPEYRLRCKVVVCPHAIIVGYNQQAARDNDLRHAVTRAAFVRKEAKVVFVDVEMNPEDIPEEILEKFGLTY
jgi:hypothetical protein